MNDLNIDDFYRDCARTFDALVRCFPRPIELYVMDIAGEQPKDEFGLPGKRHLTCLAAFLWLADEKYVRFSTTIQQEGIDQVVLTEKALVRLCQPTTAGQPLLIDRLRDSLKESSSTALAATMADFFS